MRKVLFAIALTLVLGCSGNKGGMTEEPVGAASDSIVLADSYIPIELFKTRTGHITAAIKVNDRAAIFLIDTGGGATLIDKAKMQKYGLKAQRTEDYAAGIGSVSSLVRTSATLQINGKDVEFEDLYLMDISYVNAEFKKNRARQVDGVIGTDFLDKYGAVIDYSKQEMYLKMK